MHPSISKSYIVPAIFLNPVLFLMSLNTILSRFLPPIIVDAAKQPPPYSAFGPSAQHPHLNIHSSEKLCWSYTFLIVCAQLLAEAKPGDCKENGEPLCMNGNGYAKGAVKRGSEILKLEPQENGSPTPDTELWHLEASDEDSTKTSDSEIIL